MAKIICISGTHGIGKSVLTNHLKSILTAGGATVLTPDYGVDFNSNPHTSPERRAKYIGFNLNEQVTFEAEYYMFLLTAMADIETRKKAELNNIDYIIYDRGIFDIIPYAFASLNRGDITSEEYNHIESLVLRHWKKYPVDIIINPCRFDTIEDDGVRALDPKFQLEIESLFNSMIYTNMPYMSDTDFFHLNSKNLQDRVYQCFTLLTFLKFDNTVIVK